MHFENSFAVTEVSEPVILLYVWGGLGSLSHLQKPQALSSEVQTRCQNCPFKWHLCWILPKPKTGSICLPDDRSTDVDLCSLVNKIW